MLKTTAKSARAFHVGQHIIGSMPSVQGQILRILNAELHRLGMTQVYAEDGDVYDVEVRIVTRAQPRQRWCKACRTTRPYTQETCPCGNS